jgi:hypothetical protein
MAEPDASNFSYPATSKQLESLLKSKKAKGKMSGSLLIFLLAFLPLPFDFFS